MNLNQLAMQRGDEEKAQTKTLMANLKAKVLSIPNKPKQSLLFKKSAQFNNSPPSIPNKQEDQKQQQYFMKKTYLQKSSRNRVSHNNSLKTGTTTNQSKSPYKSNYLRFSQTTSNSKDLIIFKTPKSNNKTHKFRAVGQIAGPFIASTKTSPGISPDSTQYYLNGQLSLASKSSINNNSILQTSKTKISEVNSLNSSGKVNFNASTKNVKGHPNNIILEQLQTSTKIPPQQLAPRMKNNGGMYTKIYSSMFGKSSNEQNKSSIGTSGGNNKSYIGSQIDHSSGSKSSRVSTIYQKNLQKLKSSNNYQAKSYKNKASIHGSDNRGGVSNLSERSKINKKNINKSLRPSQPGGDNHHNISMHTQQTDSKENFGGVQQLSNSRIQTVEQENKKTRKGTNKIIERLFDQINRKLQSQKKPTYPSNPSAAATAISSSSHQHPHLTHVYNYSQTQNNTLDHAKFKQIGMSSYKRDKK